MVKRCPQGCFALTAGQSNGAFVEQGRLAQLDLASGRVAQAWPLPSGDRERVVLSVTRRAVFAILLSGGSWRVYRGELADRRSTVSGSRGFGAAARATAALDRRPVFR